MRIETLYSKLAGKLRKEDKKQKKKEPPNEIQSWIGKGSTKITCGDSLMK
jgi:hypothetical protein